MGTLEIIFIAWLAYVITAALLYGWHGLKYHPMSRKGQKKWYHVVWIIFDVPVIIATYLGALFLIIILKILGLTPNEK